MKNSASTTTAIQTFHLSEAAEKSFAYAQATACQGHLYIAGTLSLDEAFAVVGEGDMAAQLAQVYSRIRATLEAHGASFSDVLKETVYVTDMDAMLAANSERAKAYGTHTPACTVVEISRLAFPGCMVEIDLTACLPDKAGPFA
jgi:2-iminobutanoate/2-iminopropanoate deaminase